MEICLESSVEGILEFTKSISNKPQVREYFGDLAKYGLFEDLNEFIKIMFQDERERNMMKREVLRDVENISLSDFNWRTNDEFLNVVDEFNRDAFRDEPLAAHS